MRKLLVLAAMLFTVTTFSACSLREEFDAQPTLISKSGIIIEQTAQDKENGTHFLIADDKSKTAVRSLTINLSDPEYLNNKVQAMGIFNDSDNVFEISGITVDQILSTNTKQKKQIDYKNTVAGFKLKYFDDWSVSTESNGDILFTAPLDISIKAPTTIRIHQMPFKYEQSTLPDGTTDTALMAYYAQENTKKLDTNLIHKIGIDQIDAIKTVDANNVSYTLYRSGLIYQINFTSGDPVNAADLTVFDGMLADFQFLAISAPVVSSAPDVAKVPDVTKVQVPDVAQSPDLTQSPVDSSVVETAPVSGVAPSPAVGETLSLSDMEMTDYESLPYKFSGKYPTRWYYAGVKSSTDSDVLHHYGFSDQVINDKNEIIGLDILSGSIPSGGNKMTISGKELTVFEIDGTYAVYATLNKQNFRFKGPVNYKNLILFMAASLDSIDSVKN